MLYRQQLLYLVDSFGWMSKEFIIYVIRRWRQGIFITLSGNLIRTYYG